MQQEVINAQNDHQFFKAVKYIRNSKTKHKNIVHDKHGKVIANQDEQYKIVKQHFQEHSFETNKNSIQRFVGEPQNQENNKRGSC